jgi:hypothetical protein
MERGIKQSAKGSCVGRGGEQSHHGKNRLGAEKDMMHAVMHRSKMQNAGVTCERRGRTQDAEAVAEEEAVAVT